jgi:hypothetical protein
MTLDEARRWLGHVVIYRPDRENERGIVTAVTDDFVFVKYGQDQHSKATRAEDLDPPREGGHRARIAHIGRRPSRR